MLQQIKDLFNSRMDIPGQGPSTSGERAIQTATCAVLLETAMADHTVTKDEMGHVYAALKQLYGLDHEAIQDLVTVAREERKKAIDLWQFTSLINQHYTIDQKISLLDHIWRVILSDGTLDKFEDALARQLKPLLNLDQRHWIEAKMRAKEALKR